MEANTTLVHIIITFHFLLSTLGLHKEEAGHVHALAFDSKILSLISLIITLHHMTSPAPSHPLILGRHA
jgi:hypothetical protein